MGPRELTGSYHAATVNDVADCLALGGVPIDYACGGIKPPTRGL
jgi:hypothetical protein